MPADMQTGQWEVAKFFILIFLSQKFHCWSQLRSNLCWWVIFFHNFIHMCPGKKLLCLYHKKYVKSLGNLVDVTNTCVLFIHAMCKMRPYMFLFATRNLTDVMAFKKKKKGGSAIHTVPELPGIQHTKLFRFQSLFIFLKSHYSTDVSGLQIYVHFIELCILWVDSFCFGKCEHFINELVLL